MVKLPGALDLGGGKLEFRPKSTLVSSCTVIFIRASWLYMEERTLLC